jgi:mevalonate pyrophosphate decarboxylase
LISCKVHNWLSVKLDYCIKYYSGRFNTYKLDRTIVMVGAPRMLVMSTSPASAGASSCASAAAASSAATAAGAALSYTPVAITSSAEMASGSVFP